MPELATLTEASEQHGKGRSYYRLLRHRNPDTFPAPRQAFRGVDLFDVAELAAWDASRVDRRVTTTKESDSDD